MPNGAMAIKVVETAPPEAKIAEVATAVEIKAKRLGRPLTRDAGQTLAALRPWEAAGVSRRTWFRRKRDGVE